MSIAADIPRNPFGKASPEEVLLIFGCCAAILLFLVVFRTVINIIIIDICLLGNCSAWKRICCCQLWNAVRAMVRNDRESGGDNSTDSNNGQEFDSEQGIGMSAWTLFRVEGTIVDPVHFLNGSPKEVKEKFLNSIIDRVS